MKIGRLLIATFVLLALFLSVSVSQNFFVGVSSLKYPGVVLAQSTSVYNYETGSLVNDKGTIYFIHGTVKIPFTNFEAFSGLGYSLKNVQNGDLSYYTSAKTYYITTANDSHPWGSWLLNNGTVYYAHEIGLVPVSSWDIFLNNGGKGAWIVKANKYDLELLNSSPVTELLASNDSRIYSSQSSGVIQPNYLTNSETTTKLNCQYPEPLAGFHYEGTDTSIMCGKYLVLDTGTNFEFTDNCYLNNTCSLGLISTTTSTSVATTTSVGVPTVPIILGISQISGTVGTEITLSGLNFTATNNKINFGTGFLPGLASVAGTQIKFNVPSSLNIECYISTPQCQGVITTVEPGKYSLSVTNANGTSSTVEFEVLASSVCQFPILCAAPPEGYVYQGNGECTCGTLVPVGTGR